MTERCSKHDTALVRTVSNFEGVKYECPLCIVHTKSSVEGVWLSPEVISLYKKSTSLRAALRVIDDVIKSARKEFP